MSADSRIVQCLALLSSPDELLQTLVRSRDGKVDKEVAERVERVTKKNGISVTAVATAWCIAKGANPITGFACIDQAVQNSKIKLSEDTKYLEEPHLPKPIQGH